MYGDGVFRATEEKGIRELEITPGPIPARMTCARYMGEVFQKRGLARIHLLKYKKIIDRAHDEDGSDFQAHHARFCTWSRRRGILAALGSEHDVEVGSRAKKKPAHSPNLQFSVLPQ